MNEKQKSTFYYQGKKVKGEVLLKEEKKR